MYTDTPPPPRKYGARPVVATSPIDPLREREFRDIGKSFGLTVQLKNSHNLRFAYWRIEDPAPEGRGLVTGFDSDVERLFGSLKLGKGWPTLSALRPPNVLQRSSTAPNNLTGGPFCVVCDTPGGLPCPSMVKTALGAGIKLAYPEGDVRLAPCHVHPGRCRKRLRHLLDVAAK